MRLALAVAACVSLAACDRPLSGPARHPWASWEVGTTATFDVKIGGRTWVERWEVVDITDAGVRLRVTRDGRPDDQTHAIAEAAWTDDGRETLALAGRSFDCRRQKRGDDVRWLSDDLPAWPVRERNAEGETSLVSLRVSEREFGDCFAFETRLSGGGTAVRWKTLAVPGQVVFEGRRTEIGEASVRLTAWSRGSGRR